MKNIVMIDTNVFKYYLSGDFHKEVWTQKIFSHRKPCISSATLCEYLVSRMNSAEEVKKTIEIVIDNFNVICDSEFQFIGLRKDNQKVDLLYRGHDIYDIPRMNEATVLNYLKVVAALKAATEMNYLYSFLECIRRMYIWILFKYGFERDHVYELQKQLKNMYGENRKRYALELAEKYHRGSDKKEIEQSFSDFFYNATIQCFEEINSIFGIHTPATINPKRNILLEFIRLVTPINDADTNLRLIKDYIKQTAEANRSLMRRNLLTDPDEEYFITDKMESMFLSRERMKFKKNDIIDLAFLGCINQLKNESYDVTFITNDKRLHDQMNRYSHRVILFNDLVGK